MFCDKGTIAFTVAAFNNDGAGAGGMYGTAAADFKANDGQGTSGIGQQGTCTRARQLGIDDFGTGA